MDFCGTLQRSARHCTEVSLGQRNLIRRCSFLNSPPSSKGPRCSRRLPAVLTTSFPDIRYSSFNLCLLSFVSHLTVILSPAESSALKGSRPSVLTPPAALSCIAVHHGRVERLWSLVPVNDGWRYYGIQPLG